MSDWHIADEFSVEAVNETRGLIYRSTRRGAPFRLKFVHTPILAWLGVASDQRALRGELKHIFPRNNKQCSWLLLKLQVALERANLKPVTFHIDDLILPAERPRIARQRRALRDRTWHRLGFLLSTHYHVDLDTPWPAFDGFAFRLVDPSIDVQSHGGGHFEIFVDGLYDRGQPPASVTIAPSRAALAHHKRCRRIAEGASS